MKNTLILIALAICSLSIYAIERTPPQIEVSGACYHNFGNQYIAYDSSPAQFIVTNTGNYNLFIYNLFFSADNPVFSAISSLLPITIAPGESDTLKVIFHPLATSSYLDTLWVTNNDPQHKELPISLVGRGIRVPPSEVQNLQINVTGADVILNWDEVSTNILGGAIEPIYYLLQYSEDGAENHFWNLAISTTNTYCHQGATIYADQRFYRIKAVFQNQREAIEQSLRQNGEDQN